MPSFRILEESFAKFCCTTKYHNFMTEYKKDMSVLSRGTPRRVGITETYLNPLIMNSLNQRFLVSPSLASTATMNCVLLSIVSNHSGETSKFATFLIDKHSLPSTDVVIKPTTCRPRFFHYLLPYMLHSHFLPLPIIQEYPEAKT